MWSGAGQFWKEQPCEARGEQGQLCSWEQDVVCAEGVGLAAGAFALGRGGDRHGGGLLMARVKPGAGVPAISCPPVQASGGQEERPGWGVTVGTGPRPGRGRWAWVLGGGMSLVWAGQAGDTVTWPWESRGRTGVQVWAVALARDRRSVGTVDREGQAVGPTRDSS